MRQVGGKFGGLSWSHSGGQGGSGGVSMCLGEIVKGQCGA